ncbi:hypothetical protein OJAV_G00005810 [Oryzias javanicus]|uniref:Uncharacterized protein n=1 Tax=Oryzias javanicus TaxID=123683 RepID=A0A3S2N8W2_ORYJA|nr:hypothetical protein OJAV_G00005810 [Oryzias javanicus]
MLLRLELKYSKVSLVTCSLGAVLGVPAGIGTHLIISAARWLPTFGILQPRVPITNHLWISPLSCLTATDSALPAHRVLQLQKDKGTPLTSPNLGHHLKTPVQPLLSSLRSQSLSTTSACTPTPDSDAGRCFIVGDVFETRREEQ